MFDFGMFSPGSVAVVTGAASGIGLAAAHRFAAMGFKVALVDLPGDSLDSACREVAKSGGPVMDFGCDVSDLAQVQAMAQAVQAKWGDVSIVMNNAGIQPGSTVLDVHNWHKVMAVNLWGIIHGCQTFVPDMLRYGKPGLIINTGSKQGITTPPGDPAYNFAKADVKVYSEALQHQLRNMPDCALSVHLLIPGFVYTPLTANGRAEKPAAAWTPDQTIDFMMKSLSHGDFYILCPDNDVSRALDEKRIAWAAGDIVENRPPLSRWHKDYADAFSDYLKI